MQPSVKDLTHTMQPSAKDPAELRNILDRPGRHQLATLVDDAIQHMRAQLRPRDRAPARVVACFGAAVRAFDAWRDPVVDKLRAVLELPKETATPPCRSTTVNTTVNTTDTTKDDLISFDPDSTNSTIPTYQPLPTSLSQRPLPDRTAILSCILLILLSEGAYSAYSRVLLLHLAASLALPTSALAHQESAVATTLIESSTMTADAETARRRQQNQASRMWKVGLASVAGAAVVGITGGLAAPVVAGALGGILGGVGLGGVASFLGVFWMNGALVGTLFGAFGAKMTGERMDRYAREVEDFSFFPLDKMAHRLRLTVGVNGWLDDPDDVSRPWRVLPPEVYALRYEPSALLALGASLHEFAASYAWAAARNELLRRTVLASVWGALWPATLLSGAASVIDNPFAHALNRSVRAGQILADALANHVQGERPVSLVGVSLGAAVVCACLEELSRCRVFGVVESVVLVGAPAGAGPDYWAGLSTVVAGRIVNVYSDRDAMLGLLYRAHGLKVGVAGLQAIPVVRVENLDVSAEVDGHLAYPAMLPSILARCGFDVDVDAGKAKDAQPSLIDLDFDVSVPGPDAPNVPDASRTDAQPADPPPPRPPRPSQLTGLPTAIPRNSIRRPPRRSATADPILGISRISLDDDDNDPFDAPPPLQRIQSSFDYTHVTLDSEPEDDGEHGIKMVDNE